MVAKKETISIPFETPIIKDVVIHFLFKDDEANLSQSGGLYYLQGLRSKVLEGIFGDSEKNPYADLYRMELQKYVKELCDSLDVQSIEAIVCPPSSKPYLQRPYLEAIKNANNSIIDLTGSIKRKKNISAGKGIDLNSYIDGLYIEKPEKLNSIRSLLVVDDVLGRGKTVAALVSFLRNNGLPNDGRVEVMCPLWITG